MYRVTAENTENGTTQVYDDPRSMMPVMLSEHGRSACCRLRRDTCSRDLRNIGK